MASTSPSTSTHSNEIPAVALALTATDRMPPVNSPPLSGRSGGENRQGASVSPNYKESFDFLCRFHGGLPFSVTGISHEVKSRAPTETFDPTQEKEFLRWIEPCGKECNLYHAGAEPIGRITKKIERSDIKQVSWLWVDLDPNPGEDVAAAKPRILSVLRNPPAGVPIPSLIVDSGGGAQAFWKLETPISIEGDVTKAEDYKLYNLWLEQQLGGDHCHDLARIVRIPGTINKPNEKKQKRGQVEAVASVVEWHADRVYPLSAFKKAQPQSASTVNVGTSTLSAPTNIRRIENLETDPALAKVKPSVRVYISRGENPDEPGHFESRSEMVFWVCCELIRAEVPDDVIYSILTDPGFKISESILEKKGGAEKYALRQIERAKDECGTDPVSEINRDYFAVIEGGKVTYCREEIEGSPTRMNAEAIGFELAPKTTEITDGKGNTKHVSSFDIWKRSERRRFYKHGFILDPTYTRDEGRYNLWRGFGISEAQGDWSLIRSHVQDVLAAGNESHADYLLRWSAWKFQNPAGMPRVALVFRGDEGTGKGFFGNGVVSIFGQHGMRIQNMNGISGRFNEHQRNKCLIFADEVFPPDQEQEGALKGLITEPTLPIEGKGKDIIQAENYVGVCMASNRAWCIPAGIGARRFAVFDVSDKRKGDAGYFSALFESASNGGWAAMLYDLRRMDLGKWHPEANRPKTEALAEQQLHSLRGLERVVADMLLTGEVCCGSHRGARLFVPTGMFCEYVGRQMRGEVPTAREAQVLFTRLGFVKDDSARPRGWLWHSLPEARAAWDAARMPLPWPKVDGWSVGVPSLPEGDYTNAH